MKWYLRFDYGFLICLSFIIWTVAPLQPKKPGTLTLVVQGKFVITIKANALSSPLLHFFPGESFHSWGWCGFCLGWKVKLWAAELWWPCGEWAGRLTLVQGWKLPFKDCDLNIWMPSIISYLRPPINVPTRAFGVHPYTLFPSLSNSFWWSRKEPTCLTLDKASSKSSQSTGLKWAHSSSLKTAHVTSLPSSL
jgi:hypothetical protein